MWCAAEGMGFVDVLFLPELLHDAVNHLALAGDQELRPINPPASSRQ